MTEMEAQFYELLCNACKKCKSDTIAMSGGLDSVVIAYALKDRKPNAVSIIAEDFVATDLTYCQLAAKELDIPLQINKVSTSQILTGIQETIKILQNFNDIEIRNNVVMFLVMEWLKNQGKDSIITGDGADELFAGYSFLKNKSEGELKQELERIRNVMHFPTKMIGKSLGISVESPFLDEDVINFAKTIPTDLLVNTHKEKRYGKWIIRKSFENKIPKQIVWREKSPMQDGAGTAGLTDMFESLIPDNIFDEKKKTIEESDGVVIRTKESLHYYEIYRKFHDIPSNRHSSELLCPYCKYKVDENSKFCRMCGAFPI